MGVEFQGNVAGEFTWTNTVIDGTFDLIEMIPGADQMVQGITRSQIDYRVPMS
jgi:hypothetical protein